MLTFAGFLVSVLCLFNLADAQCPTSESLPSLISLGTPDGCIHGTDGSKCDVFLRMAPNKNNHSYVDFYLEGNMKGWVAVGFSEDEYMPSTDVVGCQQLKDGSLEVSNTWNEKPKAHQNVIDPSQDYMCNYSLKYEDKRLKCHFGRYSGIINAGYDYDLKGMYNIILGHSDGQNESPGGNFLVHLLDKPPVSTQAQFNVYDYNPKNTSNGTAGAGEAAFKLKMKKAHGALMSISWMLIATSGIFFAMWMKPAFTGGLWFQFHRGLMIAGVVLEVAGFICIFVAARKNKIPGLLGFECPLEIVHFTFGILATAAMLANPILGLVRCKPESPNRWIFNLSHGSVGVFALIVALINIPIGFRLFQQPCGSASNTSGYPMYQVYLGWFGFFILSHVFLFVLFTFLAYMSHGKERYELAPSLIKPILRRLDGTEYEPLNAGSSQNETTDVKAKDSVLRVASFGIYCTVNTIMVAVLVAMIGSSYSSSKS